MASATCATTAEPLEDALETMINWNFEPMRPLIDWHGNPSDAMDDLLKTHPNLNLFDDDIVLERRQAATNYRGHAVWEYRYSTKSETKQEARANVFLRAVRLAKKKFASGGFVG